MVRQREFDEEKALDDAMLLFWEKGYKATSLSDLTAKMGIQRPSLYSAFGDKEKLFEAALRKYTKLHASHIRTKLQNNLSVKEAFHTFFEDLVEEEYKESPNKGCFCINTMVELALTMKNLKSLQGSIRCIFRSYFKKRLSEVFAQVSSKAALMLKF